MTDAKILDTSTASVNKNIGLTARIVHEQHLQVLISVEEEMVASVGTETS